VARNRVSIFNTSLQHFKKYIVAIIFPSIINGPVTLNQGLIFIFYDKVLAVRYEELVPNTKNVSHNICSFMQMPFDKNMLLYHKKGYSEYGRYYHSLHRRLDNTPDINRIDAWRNLLSNQQQGLIEQICGPLMQQLGYKKETRAKSSQIYIILLNFERLFGLCLQGIYYLLYRKGYIRSFLSRK
jgi:hypothetical protein